MKARKGKAPGPRSQKPAAKRKGKLPPARKKGRGAASKRGGPFSRKSKKAPGMSGTGKVKGEKKSSFFGMLGEYWKLFRFEHAVMLAVAVIIAEVIVLGAFPPLETLFFLTLIVPVFSGMGSFALNDYLDVEADRINRVKNRPLVEGTIEKETAAELSISCFAISIAAAFFINPPAFAIALAYNVLAILYNTKLKDLPLAGNAFIATTMGIPFIFGAYAYSASPSVAVLAIALLGFVSGLAREILKSVEDMEGDLKARGSRTLPILVGKGKSVTVSAILFIFFVPLTIIPFISGLELKILSGIFLFLADIAILAIAFQLFCKKDGEFLSKARKHSLAALFCGLLSLMLASLGL